MKIPEELLHFIWRFRMFDQLNLKTTEGANLKIIDVGTHNKDGGADFSLAKIKLDDTLWVGDVEIHIHEQNWQNHTHHQDTHYNRVVLHVVWELGEPQRRPDSTLLPTLQLSKYVDQSLLEYYQRMMNNSHWISCSGFLNDVGSILKTQTLTRMSVERLESRYYGVLDRLTENTHSWQRVYMSLLFRAFGMKVNADAFERLSEIVSLEFLNRKRQESNTVVALLFGQAGFLNKEVTDDKYYIQIRKEYEMLKSGMKLKEMSEAEWKFLRMRPYNFPTIRLAQLAALLQQFPLSFSQVLECKDLNDLTQPLEQIRVDPYWETHFRFGKKTTRKEGGVSKDFIRHLVINVFAWVKFSYGRFFEKQEHCDIALEWLQNLKPESNTLVQKYKDYKMPILSTLDSQACIHLYNEYCKPKKCLECTIGTYLMRE